MPTFQVVVEVQSAVRIVERQQPDEEPEVVAQQPPHLHRSNRILHLHSNTAKVIPGEDLLVLRRDLPLWPDLEDVGVLGSQLVEQVSQVETHVVVTRELKIQQQQPLVSLDEVGQVRVVVGKYHRGRKALLDIGHDAVVSHVVDVALVASQSLGVLILYLLRNLLASADYIAEDPGLVSAALCVFTETRHLAQPADYLLQSLNAHFGVVQLLPLLEFVDAAPVLLRVQLGEEVVVAGVSEDPGLDVPVDKHGEEVLMELDHHTRRMAIEAELVAGVGQPREFLTLQQSAVRQRGDHPLQPHVVSAEQLGKNLHQ